MKIAVCGLAAWLAAGGICLAEDLKATQAFTDSEIRFEPGGKYSNYTLTVTGPIDYEIGCVQTLHIWAEDSQHQQVWEQPVPAIQCMAFGHKLLAAGEKATFTADWPTSSTLAPGSYTLHGLFRVVLPMGAGARVRENLPPLTIQILA